MAEPPNEAAVMAVIKLQSNGKAHGSSTIPAEVYQIEGTVSLQTFTELFQTM
jgi:hypothetical protein